MPPQIGGAPLGGAPLGGTGGEEGLQYAKPDADVSAGGWTPSTGGDLYACIDEPVASDADYIQSSDNPDNDECRITLSNVIDPQVSTGHIIRYRYRKQGTDQIDLVASLYQSTTLVHAETHTNIGTGFIDGEFALTNDEADAITDYAALEFRFKANKP